MTQTNRPAAYAAGHEDDKPRRARGHLAERDRDMKTNYRKLALTALALLSVAALAGCGNVSRNVAKDGKSAGELVWPAIGSTTPMHHDGTWPNLDNLRSVHPGLTKNQVAALVGYPHFSEGVLGVREWNYVFHFRTADNPDMVCQYKVLYDDNKLAQSFYWKPASCADELQPATAVAKAADKHYKLSADALFAFDKSSLDDITADGHAQLDKLAQQILADGDKPGMVRVFGYADRLGTDDYNDRLSRRRAYTVMDYLVKRGVPADSIMVEGRGSMMPVATDCRSAGDRAAVIACLQPNRRVEVVVTGRS